MQEKTKQILVLILVVSIVVGFVVPGMVLDGSDDEFKTPVKEEKLCQSEQDCWLVCGEKPKAVPCIKNLCEITKCEEVSALGEAGGVTNTARLKVMIDGKEKELPINTTKKSSFV